MITHVVWDLGETINTLPSDGMDLKPLDQYSEIELRKNVSETLEAIKRMNFIQAVLSNTATSNSKHARRMLHKLGIEDFFQLIFATQSELEIDKPQKPDPIVFQHLLDVLKIESGQAVMIGNTWDTDIIGANQIGMHAIWLQNPMVSKRVDYITRVSSPPWIIPVYDVADIPLVLRVLAENS